MTMKYPSERFVEDKSGREGFYFEEVLLAYQQAEKAAGLIERNFVIGGRCLRFCFAGPALLPLIIPALEHLETTDIGRAELTIYLWDSASTGIAVPFLPWKPTEIGARGELPTYKSDRFYTVFLPGADTLNIIDFHTDQAMFWVPDAQRIPHYDWSAPVRNLLFWWMARQQLQMVHAAAVGSPVDGGILLAGKGGSGKSTTAISAVLDGLGYLGDDHVLVGLEPVPTVYSLYNTGKIEGSHLRRFPCLSSLVVNSERLESEKGLIFFNRHFPKDILKECPIRAVFLPVVSGRPDTRLVPVSPAVGLAALAPSTILQLPYAGKETFHALARILQRVPVFRLELGTDLSQIPGTIRNYLKNFRGSEE